MPMAECSAFGILSRQSHARAFSREGRECKSFAGSPIQRTLTQRHLPALAHSCFDLGMRMEIFWHRGLHLEQLDKPVAIDTRVDFLDVFVCAACIATPNAARNL